MDYVDVHDFCSVSALVIGAPGSEWILLPKQAAAFWEGHKKIFCAVSEDLLGGTEKAEDAKLQGAGIIPKQCPMERAGMGTMHRTSPAGTQSRTHKSNDGPRRNTATSREGKRTKHTNAASC